MVRFGLPRPATGSDMVGLDMGRSRQTTQEPRKCLQDSGFRPRRLSKKLDVYLSEDAVIVVLLVLSALAGISFGMWG
jgi:hypothetical protein